jgi:type 1 glutamine amidotransferase
MTFPTRSLSPHLLALLATLLVAPSLRAAPGQVFPPLTDDQIASVEAALPPQAAASPAQPRRVLIFFRTEGFVHASIPVGRLALQRLGEKTGAYTSVASDDMAMFDPGTLNTFDAVVFVSSTKLSFTDPAHRQALLDFVRNGKGVAGIHAATDNFPTWPEGQALMGGVFHSHPWNARDVSAVKNDEPEHVVNEGFGGHGFWIRDEIYQMRTPPYSRDRQRVLLSLDMSKPENARPAKDIERTDNDFGISWIRQEGRGRVFYTSLGHNTDVFFVPSVLKHVLDGMQFALGDLAADATPSAQLNPAPQAALAPAEKKTLQELTPKTPARAALPDAAALRATLAGAAATDNALWAALDRVRLLGVAGAVPEIEKLAARPDFVDRTATVLGALRHPTAKAALLRLSTTVPAGARAPVIQALAAYPAADVSKRLGEIAAAPDAADANAARETLAGFGRKDALLALEALPPSPEVTRALIAAAANIAVGERDAAKLASERLQQILAAPGLAPALRVEALAVLAQFDRGRALATAEPLLAAPDRRVRQTAAALLASDPARVDALARRWPELPVDVRVVLLATSDSLASLPLVRLALADADPLAYEAGTRAAARIGDVNTLVSILPRLAEPGHPREHARLALANSTAPELTARLRAAATQTPPPAPLPALLTLLADRYDRESLPLVLAACASETDELRATAFGALVTLCGPGDLSAVLSLAPHAKKSAERRDWRKALFNTAAMHASGAEATSLLVGRLAAAPEAERPVLIGALTLVRAPEAGSALEKMLAAPEAEPRKAVIRALSAARGKESLELLVKVAAGAGPEDERILALRGAVETIPGIEGLLPADRITHYRTLWPLTFRQEEKDAILAAVRQIKDRSANKFLEDFAPAPLGADAKTAG